MEDFLVLLAFWLTPDKEGMARGIEWLMGWDEETEDIEMAAASLGGL